MRQKKVNIQRRYVFPVIVGLLLITGISMILYPFVSNYLAEQQQKNVIIGYEENLKKTNKEAIQKEWKKALQYNMQYQEKAYQEKKYLNVLNIMGNGVIGYIEIPDIQVKLPIYHGSDEESLKKGVGHVKETALPIGGKGNRPVLTGHRGMPGVELFTRLDELKEGDLFYIHVMDRILTYEITDIQVVLPEKVSRLCPVKDEDLVTLVTCTPYAVNTHRLLITGKRIFGNQKNKEKIDLYGRRDGGDKGLKDLKWIVVILIMAAGIGILLYPYITHEWYCAGVAKKKKTFEREIDLSAGNAMKLELLYQKLQHENQRLYRTGQQNLTDAFAYEQEKIELSRYGLEQNIIAFLTIPDIDVELPVLLGANQENMKLGAAHLTETSYPIGGKNTNCVIAAHRGYSRTAMFRDIDKLDIGDPVYLENFREELEYEVVETKVINPDEAGQIMIQRGKDMLTLITCHPYRHNHKRYVVFCEKR